MSHKGVLFLGFLALAGIIAYAATRKPKAPTAQEWAPVAYPAKAAPSPAPRVEWTRVEPPRVEATAPSPSTVLKNKAEWDITYNADGLPTKIIIHREIKQFDGDAQDAGDYPDRAPVPG